MAATGKKRKGSADLYDAIGVRLRDRRQDLCLTLRDVGERCEVTLTHLWRIETGQSSPSLAVLWRLSRALGVSIDWIVTGAEFAAPRG